MRILDVFRGNPPVELTIDDPVTSCGVNFERKGHYLLWLSGSGNGPWQGYGQFLSRGVGTDNSDLRYAQAMKSAPATGRIYGTLDRPRLGRFVDEQTTQPLSIRAGAIVIAKGSAGTFQAAVAPNLTFDLPNVPQGKYTVQVLGLPPNLAVDPEQVQLHGGGCKELFFYSGSNARVTARVFGSGKLPRSASVHFVPLNSTTTLGRNWVMTDESGKFEFKRVQPGKYILGLELGQSPTLDVPYASRYYPDTKDAATARVFEVRQGEQVEGIEFDLGSEVPRRRVHVRVLWKDGSPAVKATTYLRDAHNPYSSVAEKQTETDANGEAALEGFIDTDYDVDANAVCTGSEVTRDIKKKFIVASAADAFLELQVSGRKCVLVGSDR
jgi:hypothetical protein